MKKCKSIIAIFAIMLMVASFIFPMNVASASEKLKINKKQMTLLVGEKGYVEVGDIWDSMNWKSSNKKIAKVNKWGTVTAVKKGTAVISCKYKGKVYSCVVTVKEKPSLVKSKSLCVGMTVNLKLKGTSKKAKWKSLNKKVATVSKKGVVKGVSKGKAKIVAEVGKKTLSCQVSVLEAVPQVQDVTISNSGLVRVSYYAESYASIVAVSSDPSVVEIDYDHYYLKKDGMYYSDLILYGLKSGEATISVMNKINDDVMSFKVTVNKPSSDSGEQVAIDYLFSKKEADRNLEFEEILGTLEIMEMPFKALVEVNEDGTIATGMLYNPITDLFTLSYCEYTDKGKLYVDIMKTDDDETKYYADVYLTNITTSKYYFATIDLTTYDGTGLVFEDGMTGSSVSEDENKLFNELTLNGINELDKYLQKTIEKSLKDFGFAKL